MLKIRDYKLQPLTKFERPYFSPNGNTYEMDWILSGSKEPFREYLFIININTRYLFVEPSDLNESEKTAFVAAAVKKFNDSLPPGHKISNIRADGASTFGYIPGKPKRSPTDTPGNKKSKQEVLLRYLRDNNITLFNFPSHYTNKCRIVDRAARTIRDIVGAPERFLAHRIVLKAVEQYNNTPHAAFNYEYTPAEVQANHELEQVFIRENQYRLDAVNKLQHAAGLFNYKPGDILLIHLDTSKDETAMQKKRRVFNRLAEFVTYEYGNVKCQLLYTLHPDYENYDREDDEDVEDEQIFSTYPPIVIPIYYTKYLAANRQAIPQAYRKNLL
jgi:hypothetical protein